MEDFSGSRIATSNLSGDQAGECDAGASNGERAPFCEADLVSGSDAGSIAKMLSK